MLKKELLSTDVTLVCVQHALSTEKEETMGLLIGKVHNNNTLVSIVSTVILRCLDKKPDRVLISEEHLVQATLRAEELAAAVGRPLRVVGSHWVSIHVGKNNISTYFDSFSRAPKGFYKAFLNRNFKIWYFNSKKIQKSGLRCVVNTAWYTYKTCSTVRACRTSRGYLMKMKPCAMM